MAVRTPARLVPLWPLFKAGYTRATRAVAPVTRRLSRARGGYLPRRGVATVDESIAAAGGRMWVAREREQISRAVPTGEPPRHPRFVGDTELVAPRLAVAELPEARVLGRHRVVIDRRDTMIEEFGLYWGTQRWSEHQAFWHPFPDPPLEVDGMLGVLAGRGDLNYFHFMVDIFPRLALFELDGVPTPDRWYMPLEQSWQRELFELSGFLPSEGVIDADREPHVRAEALLVPGMPDQHKRIPPWSIDFIRERLRPPDSEVLPGKRIYVSRGSNPNNRIVRNEAEVMEVLADRGFTVVDPAAHPMTEEIRLFAEAECIVSPHGAALTNLVFTSPGASVIELLAPRYVEASYWKVADCIPGLTYRYLLGTGRMPRPGREERGVMDDITVDVAALRRVLDSLPSEARVG
ncbi:MAG TPA: glycosyltransferase family 61 protein [Solirubrobacterales bacterium]